MDGKLYITDFVQYLVSEKGASQHTIDAYRGDLEAFHEYANVSHGKYTKEHILGFLTHQRNQNFASSTVARRMIALKVFFKFLKREGEIPQNIALYLDTPKQWKTLPHYLTEEEMNKLLAIEGTSNDAFRDRAILELLYSSGVRVSELCRLKIYDVDDLFIKVMGKGHKERIVPLGRFALEAIDAYLCHVRSQYESEQETTLFLNSRGRPVTREYVWKRVKLRAKEAGIIKEISPHTLRHTYATHLLDHGADLRVIQEMLGHATIASTDRYTHVSCTKLQEAFHAYHPRNR